MPSPPLVIQHEKQNFPTDRITRMDTTKAFKKRGVDYQVPEVMHTLTRRYTQSEEIYREELDKIWYRRWQLACREEELPNPGDFVNVPVGDEQILVVRDTEGEIKAHFNVCRHRGTRLCEEAHGHFENSQIVCPYHAWRYRLDGTLQAAPLMHKVASFDKTDFGLYEASVARWAGFIFINLAKDPAPFEVEMGALSGRFDPWAMADLHIAHHFHYELDCNWKIILQNYQECYHCPGVHPLLAERTPFRGAVHDCMDGAVIGGYMRLQEAGGGMTMDGGAAGPALPGIQGDMCNRIYYYSVFPNLLLSPHPDFVMYHRIRPVAVDRIINDCFFLLPPPSIEDPSAMQRFQSALDFWDLTNKQDWQVCEQMQRGQRSRRFEYGRYTPQEDILYALDREILMALGHA